jgi:hypothetical protein
VTNEELRAQARTTAPPIKIAGVLWLVAAMIVMFTAVVWIILAVMAGDYYANAKAVRDADGAGILSQLGSINAVKDWILPLAFLGLATYLLGFGFAFGNILRNVRLRGATMAAALPAIKKGEKYCADCRDIKPVHDH